MTLSKIASWILLGLLPAAAEGNLDVVTNAMKGTNWDVKPEILFLEKTTNFVVPPHSHVRLASTETYGGAKFGYTFARDMIKFYEANGYPNLRQALASGSTQQLDEIAKNYSFTFVYEGPDDQKAWNMFKTYSAQIPDEVFHWGWLPKSGTAHILVTTTPKVSTFSATSDGKKFQVNNPVLELPTSIWAKQVKPVFDKYGTAGKRI